MNFMRNVKVCLSSLAFTLSPTFTLIWFPMFLLSRFNIQLYTWLDDKLYSFYQRGVIFIYEHFNNTKIMFYGDYEKAFRQQENVIYISNHQSTVDWIMSDLIIARQGGIGRLRYILKEELKFIPLYGIYFYNHGCIYVNRKKFELQKAIKSLQYLKNNKISSWLVIFPEGTRFDNSKKHVIKSSVEFAEKQGLVPLSYHLTPRTKGLELVLDQLGDCLDAFYNVTILFEDHSNFDAGKPWKRILPGMFDWFNKKRVIHINIERIPLTEVPRSGNKLRNWLHHLFYQKDLIMDLILNKQLKSTDSDWPLKNGKEIPISLCVTLPCYLLLGGLTLYLWTRYWGLALYFSIFIGYGLFGIGYAAVFI